VEVRSPDGVSAVGRAVRDRAPVRTDQLRHPVRRDELCARAGGVCEPPNPERRTRNLSRRRVAHERARFEPQLRSHACS
jgi:hypothetical protein